MKARLKLLATGLALLIIAFVAVVPFSVKEARAAEAARVPVLGWSDCADGFQCATAAVPLDYNRPRGDSISLSLIRLPATDTAHRIGSLFTNPGGPGGSGVAFVRNSGKTFPAAIRAQFDIIGFDPRGVGESTPVQCFANVAEQQAFVSKYGVFPVGVQETADYLLAYQKFDLQCLLRNARILPHLSTANVARDMDLLRQAVGDAKLNYLGLSYGTFLGATYANLFPNGFRALVLDGVVDPIDYSTGRNGQGNSLPTFLRVGSNVASYQTFQEFLRLCTEAGIEKCKFAAGSTEQTAKKFDDLLQQLRTRPVVLNPGPSQLTFTYSLTVEIVFLSLYQSALWPQLADLLQLLYQDANQTSTAAQIQVQAQQPAYQNGQDAQAANLCSESANPRNPFAYPFIAQKADEQSPYFGSPWTYLQLSCATWPVRDPDRYSGPWNRQTENPILLIGTVHDPATPYHDAVSTEGELSNARLLTLNGWGHTAFLQGSACIDQFEANYLINGVLPAANTVCSPNVLPFDSSVQSAAKRQNVWQEIRNSFIPFP